MQRARAVLGERLARTKDVSADLCAQTQRALFGISTANDSSVDAELSFHGPWLSDVKTQVLGQIRRLQTSRGFKHHRVRPLDPNSLVFVDPAPVAAANAQVPPQ
eukprot:SAG31_NODE_13690_length_852_cov_17.583001_1_plen_103_part_10